MNVHRGFRVEPWALHETTLNLDALAETESLFALSNGFIGVRGNLDEGEPHGAPGSYLNGVYELHAMPAVESQYGNPESGQSVVNVTNGKLLRLLVDDEPFDTRYGELVAHDRVLDFRTGLLRRVAEWRSPAGRTIRVTSTRLVSFTHRSILAIAYEVEPLDGRANVVVQSELVANEAVPHRAGDPRSAMAGASSLVSEEHGGGDTGALVIHRTRESGLRIGAAMEHVVSGTPSLSIVTETWPDSARVNAVDVLEPGQCLKIVKFVAYGWSSVRSQPAVRDQVAAALLAAKTAGWEQLVTEQRAFLDDFWETADVELDGDVELQQALRYSLFQVLSSGARAEGRVADVQSAPSGCVGPTGLFGPTSWVLSSRRGHGTDRHVCGDARRRRHQRHAPRRSTQCGQRAGRSANSAGDGASSAAPAGGPRAAPSTDPIGPDRVRRSLRYRDA